MQIHSSEDGQYAALGDRQLRRRLKGATTVQGFKIRPGYLYTVVRAISARINQNYDAWPADELKLSYKTFLGKPCFVNHENEDPTRARGRVVAARFVENGSDKYVEVIQEIDAVRFPRLAKEIKEGGLDSVSMGAEAGFTICSFCNNKAEDLWDMCDHVKFHKGEKLLDPKTGERKLVYETCHKIGFFELSYVFDPADETAVVSKVLVANNKQARADIWHDLRNEHKEDSAADQDERLGQHPEQFMDYDNQMGAFKQADCYTDRPPGVNKRVWEHDCDQANEYLNEHEPLKQGSRRYADDDYDKRRQGPVPPPPPGTVGNPQPGPTNPGQPQQQPSQSSPTGPQQQGRPPSGGSAYPSLGLSANSHPNDVANAIISRGYSLGLSPPQVHAAVATAMDESGLRPTVSGGNQGSAGLVSGLYQQSPSSGWGTLQQVNDPNYAINRFYQSYVPNLQKYGDPFQAATLTQNPQLGSNAVGSTYYNSIKAKSGDAANYVKNYQPGSAPAQGPGAPQPGNPAGPTQTQTVGAPQQVAPQQSGLPQNGPPSSPKNPNVPNNAAPSGPPPGGYKPIPGPDAQGNVPTYWDPSTGSSTPPAQSNSPTTQQPSPTQTQNLVSPPAQTSPNQNSPAAGTQQPSPASGSGPFGMSSDSLQLQAPGGPTQTQTMGAPQTQQPQTQTQSPTSPQQPSQDEVSGAFGMQGDGSWIHNPNAGAGAQAGQDYTVKPGDTVADIGNAAGVDYHSINTPSGNQNLINPGDTLHVPGSPSSSSGTPAPAGPTTPSTSSPAATSAPSSNPSSWWGGPSTTQPGAAPNSTAPFTNWMTNSPKTPVTPTLGSPSDTTTSPPPGPGFGSGPGVGKDTGGSSTSSPSAPSTNNIGDLGLFGPSSSSGGSSSNSSSIGPHSSGPGMDLGLQPGAGGKNGPGGFGNPSTALVGKLFRKAAGEPMPWTPERAQEEQKNLDKDPWIQEWKNWKPGQPEPDTGHHGTPAPPPYQEVWNPETGVNKDFEGHGGLLRDIWDNFVEDRGVADQVLNRPVPWKRDDVDKKSMRARKEAAAVSNYADELRLHLAYGETEAPESIDTLRDEDTDSEEDFKHYVESPLELQDPDLSQTHRLDRQQEDQGLDADRRVEDIEGQGETGQMMDPGLAIDNQELQGMDNEVQKLTAMYYQADQTVNDLAYEHGMSPHGSIGEEVHGDGSVWDGPSLVDRMGTEGTIPPEDLQKALDIIEKAKRPGLNVYAKDHNEDWSGKVEYKIPENIKPDDPEDWSGPVDYKIPTDREASLRTADIQHFLDWCQATGQPVDEQAAMEYIHEVGADEIEVAEIEDYLDLHDPYSDPSANSGDDEDYFLGHLNNVMKYHSQSNEGRGKGNTMGRKNSLADRGRVASRGRVRHYSADDGHFDGGPYGEENQGVQEEGEGSLPGAGGVFISDTPASEAVAAPTEDGNISNSESNLVAALQRSTAQTAALAREVDRRRRATRRFADDGHAAEDATTTNPPMSGTDEDLRSGDWDNVAIENVETQPKDSKESALQAFRVFDRWFAASLRQRTSSAVYSNEKFVIGKVRAFARQYGIDPRVMFPILASVMRDAKKIEASKGGNMQRRAVDLDTAAPNDRVDVEAPVKDVTDADAQASQFPTKDFGHNAGDGVADPDLSTDSQIWPPDNPPGKKESFKAAGAAWAVRLAEAYIKAGLLTEADKWNAVGQFENMRVGQVMDRTHLLEASNAAHQKIASGNRRGIVPQSSIPSGFANGGGFTRAAATQRVAENHPVNDVNLFL